MAFNFVSSSFKFEAEGKGFLTTDGTGWARITERVEYSASKGALRDRHDPIEAAWIVACRHIGIGVKPLLQRLAEGNLVQGDPSGGLAYIGGILNAVAVANRTLNGEPGVKAK